MAGLMADVRKTALGAGGLVLLAVWFAASGGPADNAVIGAEALAQRQKAGAEPAAPANRPAIAAATASSWFAPDLDEEEPVIDAAPSPSAGAGANIDPNAIYRPPPTGPDFPPGNR